MIKLKTWMAAAVAVLCAAAFAPQRAEALPVSPPPAVTDVTNVALCFYVDGWNGPGLYQCGYRMRRGFGWHGHRHGHRHHHHGGRHHHHGGRHMHGGRHGGGHRGRRR